MIILKLQDLFERDLEIVYDCERRLSKELPKMVNAASSIPLQNAFTFDLEKTAAHLAGLERIFSQSLNRVASEESDHALKDMFNESEKLIKNIDPSALLDAALIIFGSEVHHHKIALYSSLVALAQALGFDEAVVSLERARNEETKSDESLRQIGMLVNPAASLVRNSPHNWLIV